MATQQILRALVMYQQQKLKMCLELCLQCGYSVQIVQEEQCSVWYVAAWQHMTCGLCDDEFLVQISGETLGVPIHVFGPETHMTAIVGMALGKTDIPPPVKQQATTANFLLPGGQVMNAVLIQIYIMLSCFLTYVGKV